MLTPSRPFPRSLGAVIFFVAFVQMMFYIGVMAWVIGKFSWFFYKTMNISGAEAVIASASPFIGQGESACLVKPFVDLMTASEVSSLLSFLTPSRPAR